MFRPSELREFLGRLTEILTELPESLAAAIKQADFEHAEKYRAIMEILNRGTRESITKTERVRVN